MGKIMLTGRSILGLEDLTAEEISRVLEMADQMKRIVLSENKKKDYLKGKSLVTVFSEASTAHAVPSNWRENISVPMWSILQRAAAR